MRHLNLEETRQLFRDISGVQHTVYVKRKAPRMTLKQHIRNKIDIALANNQNKGFTSADSYTPQGAARFEKNRTAIENTVAYFVEHPARSWTIKEIAETSGLDYHTVRKQLKGKPGYLQFGRCVRITDALYKSWLTEAVENGLSETNVYRDFD